jgi:hypothetical protein
VPAVVRNPALRHRWFNVRDFGATGGGVADDAPAIQRAINAASAVGGGVVYVPRGRYLVASSIDLASFVDLIGEGNSFPRYDWVIGAYQLGSSIETHATFPTATDTPVIDARGALAYTIANLEIVGNYKSCGIAQGSYGNSNQGFNDGFAFIEYCSVVSHNVGLGAKEFGYQKLFRCNFARNVKIGIGLTDKCGDSEISECYVNGNGLLNSSGTLGDGNTEITEGVGIYIGVASANNTVHAGKVEVNKIGMYVQAPGTIIDGVQFHENKATNIHFRNGGVQCSAMVSGCRFLGGGHDDRHLFPGAAFWVYSDIWQGVAKNALIYPTQVQFSGCSFKESPENQSTEYSELAHATADTGPGYFGVIFSPGVTRMVLSGCDVHKGFTTAAFNVTDTPHPRCEIFMTATNLQNQGTAGFNLFANAAFEVPIYVPVGSGTKVQYRDLTDASSATPASGSWYVGDRRVNSIYDANGLTSEMVCTRNGTYGTIGTVTATTTAASVTVTLSQSGTVCEGDVITIAGAGAGYYVIRHVNYSNNEVRVSPAPSNTVAGAAVGFATPVWVATSSTVGYGRVGRCRPCRTTR